ncbi:MAG: D-alanine--D-alanine ligase [Anaerolineae bacterium]
MTRVGVIFGGRSSEREASLASGRQVYFNLDPSKYERLAIFMDQHGHLWHVPDKLVIQNTTNDIASRVASDATRIPYEDLKELVDVVFIALHGKYGDDGCIQGLLELIDVPYTGSGVLPCAVSMDKPTAHQLLKEAGLEVARELVVTQREWQSDPDAVTHHIAEEVGFPCVVKPTREGSSIGVSVVQEAGELPNAMATALEWDTGALIEEFMAGMEFSVIIVGNDEPEAFIPTETTTTNPYLTYDDKYMPGRSQKITPARVDQAILKRLQAEALKAHKALGFTGYSRIDGFLLEDGRILLTDPNSTSGMAPSSFMFHQAAEAGLTPMMLVDKIVQLAQEAHTEKKGPLA